MSRFVSKAQYQELQRRCSTAEQERNQAAQEVERLRGTLRAIVRESENESTAIVSLIECVTLASKALKEPTS